MHNASLRRQSVPYRETMHAQSSMRDRILALEADGANVQTAVDTLLAEGVLGDQHLSNSTFVGAIRGTFLDVPEAADVAERLRRTSSRNALPSVDHHLAFLRLVTADDPEVVGVSALGRRGGVDPAYANRHISQETLRHIKPSTPGSQEWFYLLRNPSYTLEWHIADNMPVLYGFERDAMPSVILTSSPCLDAAFLDAAEDAGLERWINRIPYLNDHLTAPLLYRIVNARARMTGGESTSILTQLHLLTDPTERASALKLCLEDEERRPHQEGILNWVRESGKSWLEELNPGESFDNLTVAYMWELLQMTVQNLEVDDFRAIAARHAKTLDNTRQEA